MAGLRVSVMVLAAALSAPAVAQRLPADPTFCDPSSHALDAVRAAPSSHRVMYEDQHTRVLEIILAPRSVEAIHVHALPSVIEGYSGAEVGARFAYITYEATADGFRETSRNEVTPTEGYRAVWSPPEGPHAIANLGDRPVRFIRVEIKPEACWADN
ncbi:hypothetical protein GC169_07585 [bacterium]|nr:hypothetical protein [bacterium]